MSRYNPDLVCRSCGCNAETHAGLVRRWQQAEKAYKAEAQRHAVTRAEFELYKLEQEGKESWAQAKVRRQAKEIRHRGEMYALVMRESDERKKQREYEGAEERAEEQDH